MYDFLQQQDCETAMQKFTKGRRSTRFARPGQVQTKGGRLMWTWREVRGGGGGGWDLGIGTLHTLTLKLRTKLREDG